MSIKFFTFFGSVLNKDGIRILVVWHHGSEAGFFIPPSYFLSPLDLARAQKVLWVNVTDSCMYQRGADKLDQVSGRVFYHGEVLYVQEVVTHFK